MVLSGLAAAPDFSEIEIYKDSSDEGDTLMATARLYDEKFRTSAELNPADVGTRFQLTGTVTDPKGNTSEFGPLRP
jgi:hypothetical protein